MPGKRHFQRPADEHGTITAGGSQRGSALVISLMMAAILGTLLASYLTMSFNQMKLTSQQHYQQAAQRLAESALEQGLFALNHEFVELMGEQSGGKGKGKGKGKGLQTSFEGADGVWTLQPGLGVATLRYNRDLGNGRTAYVTIVVDNYQRKVGLDGIQSAVTSETVVMDASGNVVSRRRISTEMEPRNLFHFGLTATNELRYYVTPLTVRAFEPMNGYADTGSYQFDDQATLGANRILAYSGGRLDIRGRVISANPANDILGNGTKIQDDLTPEPWKTSVDEGLYHQGFTANFPLLTPPALTEENIFSAPSSWATIDLGTPGSAGTGYDAETDTYHYTLKNSGSNDHRFSVGSGQTLNIHGKTVIHVRDDFFLNHGGEVVIKPDASLVLHVGDNMQVIYGDMRNETMDPSKLVIAESNTQFSNTPYWYVLNPSPFRGAIYGRNVNLILYGKEYWSSSGTIYGAAMVKNLSTYYTVDFNYDRNIFRNFVKNNRSFDDQYRFAPVHWSEMTPTDFLAGNPNP